MEEKKAIIYVYDDLVTLDDTEMNFKSRDEVAKVAINMLQTTKGAKTAEVYETPKNNLILKFKIARKGKVQKLKLSNRGGARAGAGAKRKGVQVLDYIIHFRADRDLYEFLNTKLNKKGEYIRAAIIEKMQRENKKDSQ